MLRAYPKAWRERYGDEFAALLADDIAERPRDRKRDLDVVRAGLTARLTTAGGTTATALAALAVFVAAGTSIWTQLANGTRSGKPDMTAVTVGLVTLSICGLAIAAAAAAAAASLARAIARTVRRGEGSRLWQPAALTIAGAATFAIGAAQIAGHSPAGSTLARWTWAATESISTYWIHPGRLLALPASEVAWMLASPIAALACLRGLAGLVAATGLAATWRRQVNWLAVAVLTPALVAAATWVIGSQHDANPSLRAGTLDLALVVAMTAAVVAIDAAARRPANSLA